MSTLARLPRSLTLAAIALGALPAVAGATPTVSLQPAAGPAGTVATIRGAGLPHGRAVGVRVGATTARAVTGRRGGFAVRLRVPAGTRGWSAVTTRVGHIRVVDRFHVEPAVSEAGEVATPGRARLRWVALPGDRIKLAGGGLRRGRAVTVWLGGRRLTALRATSRGRFAATVAAAAGRWVVRSGRLRLTFTLRRAAGGGSGSKSPAPGSSGGNGQRPGSTAPGGSVGAPGGDAEPTFPMRAAFYYPWFPEAWNQGGKSPWTHYTPTLGYYNSGDTAAITRHLDEFRYGKIQLGISSWWGQGHYTDTRLAKILSVTRATGSPVRWAIYYEKEGFGDPSLGELTSDLAYLRDHYGSDPRYLRIGGRPVVFVYGDANDGCATADRWRAANASIGAYLVLKIFPGFQSCSSQPDQWHQYAPANRIQSQPGLFFTISPGFWLATDASPRLGRDITCFRRAVRDMVASKAPWQLVTTFNEWGEGTSVEPAQEWASASGYGDYLDALHDDGAGAAAAAPC